MPTPVLPLLRAAEPSAASRAAVGRGQPQGQGTRAGAQDKLAAGPQLLGCWRSAETAVGGGNPERSVGRGYAEAAPPLVVEMTAAGPGPPLTPPTATHTRAEVQEIPSRA